MGSFFSTSESGQNTKIPTVNEKEEEEEKE